MLRVKHVIMMKILNKVGYSLLCVLLNVIGCFSLIALILGVFWVISLGLTEIMLLILNNL